MSDSEEGELDAEEEVSDFEQDNGKKTKIKKRSRRGKKSKKEGKGSFISSTYRKERCEFYNKGNCIKGNLCTYSHDF
jgi:hypothetical protein